MPLPDPRTPKGRTTVLAVLGVLAGVAVVVWYGWTSSVGQVRPQVTDFEVISDASIRVGYDVTRPRDTAVTCRVGALDSRKGRVGTVEDAVPEQGPSTVHREVVIRTSSRAVTGVVESCVRVAAGG